MQPNLDKFKDAYDSSFKYELDNQLMLNWYPQRIIESTNGKSLLELGVGHGYSTAKFAAYFQRHIVIDGSKEIIEQFKTKFKINNIEIVHSYFENFTTEEKFDVIIMGFILEHVKDPALILKKYKKFLNPGGSIFITVPNAETLHKRYGLEAGLIKNLFDLSEGDKQLGHKRLYSVETLKDLILSCGYKIHKTEGIFLKPITTDQIKSLDLSSEILESMLKVGINYPELSVAILMEAKT